MATSIYPKALSSWADRVNNLDTVWAADPNELAAEIIAIEAAIGTMPTVEGKVPVGNPVTYASMGARLSDTLLGYKLPYVALYADSFKVPYGNALDYGVYNTYRSQSDDFGYYNGSDITIRATGKYLIDSYQTWGYYNAGYMQHMLAVNGVFQRGDMWRWNFPSGGPASYSADYNGRWATTSFTWFGALNKGDRIRVASENSTPLSPYPVINSSLRAQYVRA